VFVGFAAEESGLIGSQALATNPPFPLRDMAAILNLDVLNLYGRTRDFSALGLEQSSLGRAIGQAAAAEGLRVTPNEEALIRGEYFRSDHFSLARAGVPAFSVGGGMKLKGKPAGFAKAAMQAFNDKAYHSPQDEVQADWDFSGFPVLGGFALDVAREVANADRLPTWNPGDEFRPARDKSGGRIGR
jgi:Zn-dependent M28 family amino/carboxypeptidase